MPAAVSRAGTNAAMPSTKKRRCGTGLKASRRRRRKYPAQAGSTTMYTPMMTVTMTVASSTNAVTGS